MGYASYTVTGGRHSGEECGYAVDAVCDAEGCDEKIDRGLACLCGRLPGGGEDSCGGYFCAGHLFIPGGGRGQRCGECADEIEREAEENRAGVTEEAQAEMDAWPSIEPPATYGPEPAWGRQA